MEEKKSEKIKKERKQRNVMVHPFLTKITVRIVFVLILAGLFCGGGFFAFKRISKVTLSTKHAMVEQQLSYCQELVTAKYRYSDIITLKKSAGFSKSYSIIKYTGLLRVGIADFTDISFKISNNGKALILHVPQAEVLGNDLVRQEVFDEKQSIFVPISTQEIFNEIDDARRTTAEEMLADGDLLNEARDYAVKILIQFLMPMGFDEVTVE